ncbi:hypothetical protein PMI38_04209 [Pseudomonas sp. GM84]|uniref:DUF6708 domain-containing protein n=1 Tax=Pseudomonas sp. GM84 TaxID=1144340 RepID=UPI00026FC7A5|nr:DUF6708 domain-containing protein [Pseudomonas sp. GM84]EJN36042.1 hypothetical protein PMI38_04209 [Pseudomonas sp. GM84]
MYWLEWKFQWSKKNSHEEESLESLKAQQRQAGEPELEVPEGVGESVSEQIYDNDSIYLHNDVAIDIRTPNDERRGTLTFLYFGVGGTLAWAAISTIWSAINDLLDPTRTHSWVFYVFSLFLLPLITSTASYLFFRYLLKFIRLEAFTARRIIVRFNRITRKVYLLRPKHLGGIRIMDWDKTEVLIDKNMSEVEGIGSFITLAWDKGDGVDLQGKPTDHIEVTYIGKPTHNASELLAFWEYIRRYMEDGPADAPAPKTRLSKFPWPWLSLKAAWSEDSPYLHYRGLGVFVVFNVLMLPAILIHASSHWLSLLLCYEPRFPREIEEAGR